MHKILLITTNTDDTQLINYAYNFACDNSYNLDVINLYSQSRETGTVNMYDKTSPGKFYNQLQILEKDATVNQRYTPSNLASYIWKKGYEVVIAQEGVRGFDLQALANHLHCPLLLLPSHLPTVKSKRLVYLTDLRYCQQSILSYASKLKHDSLLVTHITQQGLPDLDTAYRNAIFADAVKAYQNDPEIFFSDILEKDFSKISDTLINTMQASMLICQNRQYHYNQLVSSGLNDKLPVYLTVPLLIFPC